jgi:hypothetical protein
LVSSPPAIFSLSELVGRCHNGSPLPQHIVLRVSSCSNLHRATPVARRTHSAVPSLPLPSHITGYPLRRHPPRVLTTHRAAHPQPQHTEHDTGLPVTQSATQSTIYVSSHTQTTHPDPLSRIPMSSDGPKERQPPAPPTSRPCRKPLGSRR